MPSNISSQFSLRRHLIQGVLGSLVFKLVQTGLNLGLAVVLARMLGTRGFGVYSFCISIVNVLTIPSMLGGQTLLMREVAAYKAKGDFHFLKGLLQYMRRASTIISILLAFCGAGIGFWIYQDNPLQIPFIVAMALIPFMTAVNLQGAILRGLSHILLSQANMVVIPGLVITLILLLFLYGRVQLNPESVISTYLISTGLLVFINHYLLYRRLPQDVHNTLPAFETTRWLKSMLPIVLTGGLQMLNNEASVLLLGVIQGPEAVGLYRIAQRGAELIPFGLLAVNMTIGPSIAELFARGEKERLQYIINKSIRLVIIFAVPVSLGLILFGQELISFAFGSEYASAYIPLLILCLGQLFNACVGPVGLILNMVGLERVVAWGIMIAAITNLTLNTILITFWGLTGSAVATTVSLVIWNLLLAIWLYEKTGIVSTLKLRASKL